MIRTAAVLALFLTQLIAFSAFAQSSASVGSAAEFGRASGGELEMITKHARRYSGSLGLMRDVGAGGQGYDATLGGTVVEDRLWFFASASTREVIGQGARLQGVDGRVAAQPVDWSSVSASFSDARNAAFVTPGGTMATLPSSFLSLRSTSVLSDRMVLDFSVSRQTVRANP